MRSGFFNSMKAEGEKFGDRVYRAEDWAQYFAQFIGNGVYANPAASMQVRSVSGLIVRISAGSCFINGYTGYADGTDLLTLNYGSGLPRIDRIVLRLDHMARSIYPVVIMGTAAESPVPPNIVRNNSVYDLCIAQISVAANATSVSQANITDMRSNSLVCGFVAGVINQIDTTDLFLQYETQWNEFVTQLGEDDHVIISGLTYINGKTYDENGNFELVQGDIPSGKGAYQVPYMIQIGAVSVSGAATNVTFVKPYAAVPIVACSFGSDYVSTTTNGVACPSVKSITTTGFSTLSYRVSKYTSGNLYISSDAGTIRWAAFGFA